MAKKIFILLICIILITGNLTFASSEKTEKVYELRIEKRNKNFLSSNYFSYFIYENELERLNNNEENIIVYSSLGELMDNKETIVKRINNESLMEYTLFANSLDELMQIDHSKSPSEMLNSFSTLLGVLLSIMFLFNVAREI